MDEAYLEWCYAVDLDPQEDSTHDLYLEALVASYEEQAMEADLDAERMDFESLYPDFLDFDAVHYD